MNKQHKKRKRWMAIHKWGGLVFAVFILIFCLSGIVLNHRRAVSHIDVSRRWMPASYRYDNWNNGFIKGTAMLPSGELLVYGNAGIWLTDSAFSCFTPMNEGIEQGIDCRKISRIVVRPDSSVWCAAQWDVYRLNAQRQWQCMPIGNGAERIADIECRADTLVVLSRSHLFVSSGNGAPFVRSELLCPDGFSTKVTLFQTVWKLHSGELFGLPGQIFVDIVALALAALCITGVTITLLKPILRHRSRRQQSATAPAGALRLAIRWHNYLGAWLLVFSLMLVLTGACLRPPLMVPLALTSTEPIPGTTMASSNPFHDRLRAIRWDEHRQAWLLSTTKGFYCMRHLNQRPAALKPAPPISPMGINVFELHDSTQWLIGSFSGIYVWNIDNATIIDAISGKAVPSGRGRPVASNAIAGYSPHLGVLFDYAKGAMTPVAPMPLEAQSQPISLWNFALELHVGRCYRPFLGPLSELFVFVAGTLSTLILVSGSIIYRRRHRQQNDDCAG